MMSRIDTILSEAETESVTRENLTETVIGDGAAHVPTIELLEDGEVAHVWARGRSKGFGIGTKDDLQRVGTGQPVFVVTDRRFLIQFPEEDHDVIHSVPYGAVVDAEFATGWGKRRFTIRSTEDDFHFYFSGVDKSDAQEWHELSETLRSRASDVGADIRTFPRYFSRKHASEVLAHPDAGEQVRSLKYRPEERGKYLVWKPYNECPHCSTYNYTLYSSREFQDGRPTHPGYDSDEDWVAKMYCEECEYRDVLLE